LSFKIQTIIGAPKLAHVLEQLEKAVICWSCRLSIRLSLFRLCRARDQAGAQHNQTNPRPANTRYFLVEENLGRQARDDKTKSRQRPDDADILL
jgi:hypothetical protein